MSIVTTDNTKAFPTESAQAQARTRTAAKAAGLSADFTQVLRFVPGNRIIIHGTLHGQDAVFRVPLSAASHKQVTKEWTELCRSHTYMTGDTNRVATPLHFSEDTGLMVISFVPGTPLMKHLWSLDQDLRAETFARAGAWLPAYMAPSLSNQPANTRHWLRRAKTAMESQPHAELSEIETRIFRQMRHLSKQIGDTDWRVSIPHGDFHPNNLILSGTTLTGIDTGGSSVAPITKDMARALTHMARRGLTLSDQTKFGVDARAYDALADALSLTKTERSLHLPYKSCFEPLFRVEHPDMPKRRVTLALNMARALLKDLRQIT